MHPPSSARKLEERTHCCTHTKKKKRILPLFLSLSHREMVLAPCVHSDRFSREKLVVDRKCVHLLCRHLALCAFVKKRHWWTCLEVIITNEMVCCFRRTIPTCSHFALVRRCNIKCFLTSFLGVYIGSAA